MRAWQKQLRIQHTATCSWRPNDWSSRVGLWERWEKPHFFGALPRQPSGFLQARQSTWQHRARGSTDDVGRVPGAFMLSQCVATRTEGPAQGRLAAGSRHLLCELRCPQPLAMPCASEQPRQQTSSASSRSGLRWSVTVWCDWWVLSYPLGLGWRLEASQVGLCLRVTCQALCIRVRFQGYPFGWGRSVKANGSALCYWFLSGVRLQCYQFGLRVVPLRKGKGLPCWIRGKSYGFPFVVWFNGCPFGFGLGFRIQGYPSALGSRFTFLGCG